MRETKLTECKTNGFKAKALRWAENNCQGDSMTKMAKKVSAEFGVEIKRRTWAHWYTKKRLAILTAADNEVEQGSISKSKKAITDPEMTLFRDQLNEICKRLYQSQSLTKEQITYEANKLKVQFPELKISKNVVFGRKWVQTFMAAYGWSSVSHNCEPLLESS